MHNLPLFVTYTNPLAVYVINNEIIAFTNNQQTSILPDKAFSLLCKIINNTEIDREISSIVEKYIPLIDISELNKFQCLAGFTKTSDPNCLLLQMEIKNKQEPIISLYDFVLASQVRGGYGIIKIPEQVELLSYDAFILFSNICVAAICDRMDIIFETDERSKFNPESIKKRIDDYFSKKDLPKREKALYYPMYLYTLDYLTYLIKKMHNKELSPLKILQLSGARALSFIADKEVVQIFVKKIVESIKRNQVDERNLKIIYYTLIVYCLEHSKNFFPEIVEYCNSLNPNLNSYFNELEKEFPDALKGEAIRNLFKEKN